MRAGLLSDPEVIQHLNSRFISVSTIIDDVQKMAANGDELAKLLTAQWEYPVEMMFLTPTGETVSKLNSYKDFPGIHPDVVAPPKKQHIQREDERSHKDIFLKQIALHFGRV